MNTKVTVPPEIIKQRAALLIAVGKLMLLYGEVAPAVRDGRYDAQLVGFMMQEGLSEEEARFMLEVELTEVVGDQ